MTNEPHTECAGKMQILIDFSNFLHRLYQDR